MRITHEDEALDRLVKHPLFAPFVMFSLDLGAMKNANGQLVFPELEGKETPLWKISIRESEAQATQEREERQSAADAHNARVELYRKRVELGLMPTTGEPWPSDEVVENEAPQGWDVIEPGPEQTSPQDEWTTFWGGDSPTEKMATWINES